MNFCVANHHIPAPAFAFTRCATCPPATKTMEDKLERSSVEEVKRLSSHAHSSGKGNVIDLDKLANQAWSLISLYCKSTGTLHPGV
ncbi:hypothetical protein BTUL_0252g00100 [Botrytis tulipae]|uniref:Uncharacterized protein n=1 Tax=Botrytis tulipae TaxID=87230 RepID=A0A4Z1EAV4_9HELO|nr:hypothetical protein BTUL_0252g00100 [Botrytis tulipae]